MGVQAGKVEEATRVTQRASVELRDIRERAAAALRRVEGLEEEGRELRTRINRLGEELSTAQDHGAQPIDDLLSFTALTQRAKLPPLGRRGGQRLHWLPAGRERSRTKT